MKRWVAGLVILIIVAGFIGYFYQQKQQEQISRIDSFEKCVEAGFPIMESYPPRCAVTGGKSFTQYIGNELEFHDEILVTNPRPNQKISSPLLIEGKARGIWYFEGSFSGELFDSKKNSLGTVILTAQGEWMTEEFVPFEGILEFQDSTTPTGELVIKNANPSGLSEHEKTLILPVLFE